MGVPDPWPGHSNATWFVMLIGLLQKPVLNHREMKGTRIRAGLTKMKINNKCLG